MQQRRRWERHPVDLEVSVYDGDRLIDARTQNVCQGGLGLLCGEVLAVGREYRFLIPAIADTAMAGTVRWCTPTGSADGNTIGVELTRLTEAQTQALADRIALVRSAGGGYQDE